MSPSRNPHRRTFVGVVIGVHGIAPNGERVPISRDDLTAVEATVAVYADRHSRESITVLPVRWPAGTFRPSVGTRLAVHLEPSE